MSKDGGSGCFRLPTKAGLSDTKPRKGQNSPLSVLAFPLFNRAGRLGQEVRAASRTGSTTLGYIEGYECLPKMVSAITLGFRRLCARVPASETYAQTKPTHPHQGIEFTFHTTVSCFTQVMV
jgi:hypothetical protein